MRLYLTHVGQMHLKDVPTWFLLDPPKDNQSVFIKPNKYLSIKIDTNGVLEINDVLAGFYGIYWDLDKAFITAQTYNMKIVAHLDYIEYHPIP